MGRRALISDPHKSSRIVRERVGWWRALRALPTIARLDRNDVRHLRYMGVKERPCGICARLIGLANQLGALR